VSSFEPDGCCHEIYRCEEVPRGFIVASGDGSVLFEIGEEVFDKVSSFVDFFVEVAGCFPIGLWWDHGGFARRLEHVDDPFVGVVGFIGQQNGGLHGRQKVIRAIEVVRVTPGEDKADCIAKRVDQSVYFGAQSSAGATNGLVLARFFWAPALC